MPDSTTPEKPQVPLISAAARGDYDAFSAALTESPDAISAVDANGRTALSLAAQAGHAKIVSALLDAGAHDSAAIGWTAAHHAAFGGTRRCSAPCSVRALRCPRCRRSAPPA